MGTYLQYGCGQSCPDGWVNFDASPSLRLQRLPLIGKFLRRGAIVFPDAVRFGDIRKGLPFADNSVDGIYASHVLEHLALDDCRLALRNTFRLLRPGGIFRLVVPDLEIRARGYLAKLEAGEAGANAWFMRSSYLGAERCGRSPAARARALFGNSSHLWMWDERSMSEALHQTGFAGIRRAAFNDSADKAFNLVEDRGRFYDHSIPGEECAIEAHKPSISGGNQLSPSPT